MCTSRICGHVDWTLLPRQGILEGVAQIKQAPCDDHIIVESHKEADLWNRKKSVN